MQRLDKVLANLQLVTRATAYRAVNEWLVKINGVLATRSEQKVRYGDQIQFADMIFELKEFVYILLHKPKGYVCSDEDEHGRLSYRHLIQDCTYAPLVHVAGRLDQDTEWLILLSNNGQFIHQIISPKKVVKKQYFVTSEKPLNPEDCKKLEAWVVLDDGYQTLPAQVEQIDPTHINLIITEGKYHQVKRMLEAIGNKVVYLRRDRIGSWTLEGIEMGKWKEITI